MTDRPNILLIVTDHFRADLLHGALADSVPLPNLNALAAQSTLLRRHYSVVTPCGPSRVSLLTGQYAMNHRAVRNGTPLRHDTPNLARGLRTAGYDPLLFGYTDVAQDPRVLPAEDPRLQSYEEVLPGFTEVVRMRQDSDDLVWRDHLRARGYAVPDGNALYRPTGDRICDPALYRAEDSDTAFLTDRFLAHMEGVDAGFFAMLAYIRPHPPFVAPAPWNRLVDPASVPSARASLDHEPHPFVAAQHETKSAADTVVGFPDLRATPQTVQTLRAVFLGLCAEIDHHVGRVMDWLKASGHWENTLVIFTADHGEMLGDYGLWGKGTFQDAAFHVPLVIHVPGIAPRVTDAMTESIDLAPTILDWAGCKVPHTMNGESLLPLLRSGQGGRATTFSEHDFGNPITPTRLQAKLGLSVSEANLAVLRTDTHRLVHFAGRLPQIAYDMKHGGEAHDIASSAQGQRICLDLSREMLCHRMTHPEGMFSRTMVGEGGVRVAPD
ncbi:MAG: sulfatase-like hydrolase/transferase [Pseudomonadota bacterium]